MELIFIAYAILCFVAAFMAAKKGRSGIGIFVLSIFLTPIVGIIVAKIMKPNEQNIGNDE